MIASFCWDNACVTWVETASGQSQELSPESVSNEKAHVASVIQAAWRPRGWFRGTPPCVAALSRLPGPCWSTPSRPGAVSDNYSVCSKKCPSLDNILHGTLSKGNSGAALAHRPAMLTVSLSAPTQRFQRCIPTAGPRWGNSPAYFKLFMVIVTPFLSLFF